MAGPPVDVALQSLIHAADGLAHHSKAVERQGVAPDGGACAGASCQIGRGAASIPKPFPALAAFSVGLQRLDRRLAFTSVLAAEIQLATRQQRLLT